MNINDIKLAAELAHDALVDEMIIHGGYCHEDLFIEECDMSIYTDVAQHVFDRWYDYYLTKIEECEI